MPAADLHMHTCFSDGLMRPNQVIRRIKAHGGISHFAITDHDSLSSLEPAMRALDEAWQVSNPRNKTDNLHMIPGVELSARVAKLNLSVHVLGYFPGITPDNMRDALARLDAVLGPYCLKRCEKRQDFDVAPRVERMFQLDLEEVRRHYQTPGEFMERFMELAGKDKDLIWSQCEKQGDVIQHPIPITYLDLINLWEELMPHSSREVFSLYTLRPDSARKERLAHLMAAKEEMPITRAREMARELQGSLCVVSSDSSDFLTPAQAVELLKQAGAISVLAHPAVDHGKIDFVDFDQAVLEPMVKAGLHGIEVYYPYDLAYRELAVKHYLRLADKHGLLISCGSDFHGDGRVNLAEMNIPFEKASVLKVL
jgi:predicted metal-dependent phosphoesterase TrpH